MVASDILALLAKRHEKDVFVPECKNGATVLGDHLRLDAWAMRKSWTRPLTWGYEVKVSRSDFMHDDKWHTYLPYCNEFWFVTPPNIIHENELPPEVGLLVVSGTGKVLLAKKKAQRRDVIIPEDLYRYVLMHRAVIGRESNVHTYSRADKIAYWTQWLSERTELQHLGFRVRTEVSNTVASVIRENDLLQQENKSLSDVRDRLKELGVNVSFPVSHWSVDSAMKKLVGQIPAWVHRSLVDTQRSLKLIENLLEENQGG